MEYTKETSALAEEFNRYFISVGKKASIASVNLAEIHGLSSVFEVPDGNNIFCDDAFEFRPVTCLEVGKVIMDMPNNKAPWYDKVSFSVIKDYAPHLIPIITRIINQSFASSVFPHAWKKAEDVPHLKEGDHEMSENNRPVSLLSALSKVIEKLALQQYTNYLLEKNCLTGQQSGNKRYHSTETLGLLVADHLFKAIDEKKITAMVLIDLSKAFDSICHFTLLEKLRMLGTSPNALIWFKSYLTNREQSTRIESTVSTPLIVTHGVPQGSILGPLLFNIYMNDMPKVVENSLAESFVDDSKIFLSFSIDEMEKALSLISCDLRKVAEWCCANYLLINPDKTKFIIFGTRQLLARLGDVTISFFGKELSPLPSCMDLGIIFDRYLSFNEHIDYLSSSLLGTLCQINRVRHLFTKDVLVVILNSLVFSKLFYCSTVWSDTSQQNICKLQLLQNFAARIIACRKEEI